MKGGKKEALPNPALIEDEFSYLVSILIVIINTANEQQQMVKYKEPV